MPNTSQTGGALQATPESFNIYHLLHDLIMGISGLTDNTLVRPMYQPNPPTVPVAGTDWIAYNLTLRDTKGSSYQSVSKTDVYVVKQQVTLDLTLAIYGYNSYKIASTIRSGVELSQNWDIVRPYSISFGQVGRIVRAPELHNLRWLDRYNLDISLNYITSNTASIISIVSAADTLVVNR